MNLFLRVPHFEINSRTTTGVKGGGVQDKDVLGRAADAGVDLAGVVAGVVVALAGDRLAKADPAGVVEEPIQLDVRQPTGSFLAVTH